MVKYILDAWGKVLSTTGSLASTLGTIQPFRYRGYVYDVETGLYYLRSRYYNPGWGRYINADTLIKGNLYCYCNNNPLLYLDENGTYPVIIEYMRAMFSFHEKVVCKICDAVKGLSERVDTHISGAGLHGGMGYPDVVDPYGHVWEVKPLSIYGMISGARQMRNYTTGTGKTRGYPIHIDPFEDELLGVKGIVFVFNGAIPDYDTGVVYYYFIPKIEYSLAVNPEYVQKKTMAFNKQLFLMVIQVIFLTQIVTLHLF